MAHTGLAERIEATYAAFQVAEGAEKAIAFKEHQAVVAEAGPAGAHLHHLLFMAYAEPARPRWAQALPWAREAVEEYERIQREGCGCGC